MTHTKKQVFDFYKTIYLRLRDIHVNLNTTKITKDFEYDLYLEIKGRVIAIEKLQDDLFQILFQILGVSFQFLDSLSGKENDLTFDEKSVMYIPRIDSLILLTKNLINAEGNGNKKLLYAGTLKQLEEFKSEIVELEKNAKEDRLLRH